MQPCREQYKGMPDPTTKLHKLLKVLLLEYCIFPGSVMGGDEFIKLQEWFEPECLHLASN